MSISHGLLWTYIERWGSKVVSLLTFIVLARLLGPKNFGLVAFCTLIIDYLDFIAGQGLDYAIIQRKMADEDHYNAAFWINIFLAIFLAGLVYVIAPYIEAHFAEEGAAKVLRTLTILNLITALSRVQVAIMLREHRFRQLALRGLLMAMAGGVAGITMAFQGFGVWSLVAQQITASFVALFLLWSASSWRPQFKFNYLAAKELYSFAWKLFLNDQVSFFSQKIDEAIIVALLGITQLGYYSVAKKLCVTLADMLYSSIRKVLIPVFSKMQDNIGKVAESAIRVATYAGAFTFPLFLATASANKELIIFLFGEKWESISVPFSILMASGIFMLTPAILHPFFNAIGKPGIPLKLNISRVVISALSISVGSMFGLFGVAVGVFVRALIGAVLDVSFFRREVMGDVAAFLNGQVSNLLLCLPMITAILVLNLLINGGMSHGMTLLLYCIIGGVTYISTLAVFRVGLLTDLLLKVKKIF